MPCRSRTPPPTLKPAADRQQTIDAAHRYLTETFNDVIDRALRAGVAVSHEIIDADTPAAALTGYAHDHAFDLIVCGHHPGHRAGRMLLRGITRQLIDGPVPVMVVGNGTR